MKARAANTAPRAAHWVEIERLSALAQSAYAEKKLDVVLDLSSRLLEADPENVVALKLRARVHGLRGENNLAEPIWRRLSATGPDKIEPALSLARIAYLRRDWDGMAEFADHAVRESGERADALRLAITARIKAKRADGLPELLLRLHTLEPERFKAVLKTLGGPDLAQAQACVLARLGARAKADPALTTLTRECRKSWEVGARRAASRKDDEVRASYLRAIWSFDPVSRCAIDGLNALSRERLKFLRMAIKQGDDDVALQQAEAVAKFNPTSFEAWFAIARLSATNDSIRSAEGFRICAEMKPADIYYRYREGLALKAAGRPAQAVLVLRTVADGAEDASDPIAIAADAEIRELKPAVFNCAIEAARAGRLEDARTGYIAATGSMSPGGGGFAPSAHAAFWAFLSVAQFVGALESGRSSAVQAWKRTKTRSARIRRRLLTQAVVSNARLDSAKSTPP